MRYFNLALLAATLAACGDTVFGNETGGTIEVDPWALSAAKSFPKAEQHCAQYGKRAKITYSSPATTVSQPVINFECVRQAD